MALVLNIYVLIGGALIALVLKICVLTGGAQGIWTEGLSSNPEDLCSDGLITNGLSANYLS